MDWHIMGDDVYSGPWLVARLSTDIPAMVRDAVDREIQAWDGKSAWDPGAEACLKEAEAVIFDLEKALAEARAEIDRLSAELGAMKNPPLPPDEEDEE